MLIIRLEGVQFGVQPIGDDGAQELGFFDPNSGIAVVIPLDKLGAENVALALQGEKPKARAQDRIIVPGVGIEQVPMNGPNRAQRRHPENS